MRRREFITGAAGAVAWPMAARAQQGERKRRIGVLMNFPESDPAAIINLKTAKALGLTIPETLLATADQVIE